jgi:LPS sulfotransferase NodH
VAKHHDRETRPNSSPSLVKTQWFVVIGARRTGTNILREILNTNREIAMLGEVFTPSLAPAHWPNFLGQPGLRKSPLSNLADPSSLLDEYFQFVEYRIRNHWQGNAKAASRALGLDIKYEQLREIAPGQRPTAPPFLLRYFRLHRMLLIHTIRKNVIRCAVSEMIAQQRNLWHNYNGESIDSYYKIDPQDCLCRARLIVERRAEFQRLSKGCRLIEANYEQLAAAIAAAADGQIAEDAAPLKDIAQALNVPSRFSYDGRLRRAIDVPYSSFISNLSELRRAVADSEFSRLAPTLD